ncbi:MAG: hypothetical protein MI861_02445, partial [Pirellulales bacterium]|nr:hypothetical protein [Pirellulales bacterium]
MKDSQAVDFSNLRSLNLGVLLEFFSRPADYRLLFIDIDYPSEGATVDVIAGDPGSCTGSIDVSGTITPPGNADSLGIVVRLNGGNTVTLPPQSHPDWSTNIEGVRCECPPDQNGVNTVEAQADWDLNGTLITETHSVTFNAHCTDPLPSSSSSSSSSSTSSSSSSSSSTSTSSSSSSFSSSSSGRPVLTLASSHSKGAPRGAGVEPFAVEDNWLGYRNLLTTNPFERGKVLMFNGRPLAASSLAVAAQDVRWYHKGNPRLAICRPTGTHEDVNSGLRMGAFIFGREPFRFTSAPKCSICVYQHGNARMPGEVINVVESQSRESPDVFGLAPDQPIRVRVNDS